MTWNYRMVKHIDPSGRVTIRIHEVHYDEGSPTRVTEEACAPCGESPEDLAEDLELMRLALALPLLNYDDF
jgi:hypothetical protein